MKLQIDTDGPNSALLKRILAEDLADKVIMNVLGPEDLYSRVAGRDMDMADVKQSMALVAQFPAYEFQTTVTPVVRDDGEVSYLTPEEVGGGAAMVAKASGNMKNPYLLKLFKPRQSPDKRLKSVKAMAANELLPYRTAARRHQVFVEVEKA